MIEPLHWIIPIILGVYGALIVIVVTQELMRGLMKTRKEQRTQQDEWPHYHD